MMSKRKYKVRDGEDTVIGQYYSTDTPEKPDTWDGQWNVEQTDTLNDERVEWWDQQTQSAPIATTHAKHH